MESRVLSEAGRLGRVLRGRDVGDFERRVIEVLGDDIFRRRNDLRNSEACDLAYRRLRHLNRRLNLKIADLFSDVDRLLVLHEWVGLVDGTTATLLSVHFNLCVGSILQLGHDRAALAPFLAELDLLDSIGTFLLTELAYGNNVQSLETEAVYEHETRSFLLRTPNARARKFMPNTGAVGVAKLGVVMARLKVTGRDCGIFPFLTRIRTQSGLCPGISVTPLGDKPDYPLDNAITSFDDVRVPMGQWLCGSDSRIDESGVFSTNVSSHRRRFLQSIDRVQAGKLCIAVAAQSGALATLKLTTQYSRQRTTFAPDRADVPILDYRNQQRAVFEGTATSYAAAFLLQRATQAYTGRTGAAQESVNRWLALGKYFATSSALRIMNRCRERIGAQGLFCQNRISSYLINAHGLVTAEGDNELLLIRTGRELVTGSEYEPPTPRTPSATSFESVESLVSLFHEHERRGCERLRTSLGAALAGGASRFEAWNDHVTAAIDLATLHAVRLAIDCFVDAMTQVDASVDPDAHGVLHRLFRLFALSQVAERACALTADGLLDARLAGEIESQRNRLCEELSSFTPLIVDAFGIPDGLLGAPIEKDYIAAYDALARQRPEATGAPMAGAIRSRRAVSAMEAR
jgi:acyl-CoA oxidase